jgi:hypothetical protein
MKCSVTTSLVALLITQHVMGEPLAEVVAGAAAGSAAKPAINAAVGAQKPRNHTVDYCIAPVSHGSWLKTRSAAAAPQASGKKTDSMLTLCALFAMALIAYRRLNDSGS